MLKNYITFLGISVLIITIFTLLLPNGKTKKIVKSVFSTVIVLTMFKPLIDLKNNETNVTDIYENTLQENFIYFSYDYDIKMKTDACNQLISFLGVSNFSVNIEYNILDGKIQITAINVNLKNAVIKNENVNIDIKEDIKKSISNYLKIDKEVIKIYE